MRHLRLRRRYFINFFILAISSVSLLSILINFNTIQNWASRASGRPSNIVIDTKGVLGPLPRSWQYLSQGGEAADYRFAPITNQLKKLEVKYIRIDHLYDFYIQVAKNASGQLTFDYTHLDTIITDIIASGATPFISLSYMPAAITTGDITNPPLYWSDWQLVVQNTIEHISGPSGLNLNQVYYEVWNEPDLFGNWKTYGAKNYLLLYQYASQGAQAAAPHTRLFKFGGPATTKLYDNWVTRFVDYVAQNNLRFDFLSWHHYTSKVDEYLTDYVRYDELMRRYPQFILVVEPIITEWGIDSNINPAYDYAISAAHTVSAIASITPRIPKLFSFEVQDGKDPKGQEYWGRWGLLTHQDFGSHLKPRYHALNLLNRLGNNRLSLVGNGTWVQGLAAQNDRGNTQVIVVNYDPLDAHVESVPITFQRVNPGTHTLTQEFLGRSPQTLTLATDTSTLIHYLTLPPNTVVYLELN